MFRRPPWCSPVPGVVSLVVVVGTSGVVLAGCGGGGGGDPGGAVFRQLRPVAAAVPASATEVQTNSTDSFWQPACRDGSGRAGWTEVAVRTNFLSSESESVVASQLGTALRLQGWARHDAVVTAGQGAVPHWSKTVAPGQHADVFAFPVPAGSDHWFVSARWQPPGAYEPGDCA